MALGDGDRGDLARGSWPPGHDASQRPALMRWFQPLFVKQNLPALTDAEQLAGSE